MLAAVLFVVLTLIVVWLLLLSFGVGYVFSKRNNVGPQGVVGNQGNDGNQGDLGQNGQQGVQGNNGERGFQGDSSSVGTTIIQNVTFHAEPGIRFNDGTSTAQFRGVVSEDDKLLTLTFSQILIATTGPKQNGFTLRMDLPAGYEMTSDTSPVISWLGTANNQRQPDSTPSPIYLFDFVKNSSTNLSLRWVPVNGPVNGDLNAFLWCNFIATIHIV